MPTYAYGRLIREAIESVRNQPVDDLERLVVDDGSTDATEAVVRTVDDPPLEYSRTAHSGVSAARNTGQARARGQFVAFLDADDRWHPAKLARELEVLEAHPGVDLVFSSFVRFGEDGVYPTDHFRVIRFDPHLPMCEDLHGGLRAFRTSVVGERGRTCFASRVRRQRGVPIRSDRRCLRRCRRSARGRARLPTPRVDDGRHRIGPEAATRPRG